MAKVLKTVAIIAVAVAVVVFAPQIAGVLASVAGSLGVTVAASAISSALIGMGISMALTAAATMFRKAPSMSQSLVDRLNTSVVPTASRKIVFGTTAGGQDVRFFEGDVDLPSTKKDGYVQVIALASHRINALRSFYVENDLIWQDGSFLAKRNGFAPNNPFRVVTEGKPGNGFSVGTGRYWNSASTFTGCAYYVPFWKLDEEVWESGIPQRLTAIVEGCPLYDPRRDSTRGGSGSHRAGDQNTYAFRDGSVEIGRNPALALLTYLLGWRINGKLVWGMGIPAHRIDFDNFRTYANLCEERVATQDGGTVQRYTVDGIFSTTDSHETVISGITATMGSCKLTDRGGTYCLVGGYDDTAGPKISFTADDLVAPANGSSPYIWNPAPPSRERYNIVRGRFAKPDELYQLADWGDPIEQPPLADGIPRTLSLDLGAVSRAETCQRIAKQFLLREYLTPGMFSATFGPKAFAVEIGSVITLSLPAEGWNNKLFRVMEQAETHDLFFQMTLREEDPQVYAWDREEKPLPASIRPQGYDASATISPTNLTLTSDSYSGANAVNVSEVHVAWTPELSGRVSGIQIQSRPQGTDAWTEQAALFDPKLGMFTFTSNAPGITVEVQARFRMSSAVYSPWIMASVKTAEVITVTDWKNVTDNSGTRPHDNATVGAQAGTNLLDSGGAQLTDSKIITEKGTSADTKKVNGVDAVDITTKLGTLTAGGFTDNTAPPVPTGLSLGSTLSDVGVTFNTSWNAVTGNLIASYIIAIKEGTGNYIEFPTTAPNYSRTALARNTSYTAKVASVSKAGVRSGFSAEVSITTARDTVAPAAFAITAVDPVFDSVVVTIKAPADTDLARLEVHVVEVASGARVRTQSVNALANQTYTVQISGLTRATNYIVEGLAFDDSGNSSPGAGAVSFTTKGGVAASDFAPNVSPITTVTSLPNPAGYTGPPVVYNSSDKKLYRFANGAWTSSTDGADITANTLSYANLASKPTSLADINTAQSTKLTGIKDGAGTIADTRDTNFGPSYYYARVGETQEFKSSNFGGSGSSGYGTLITTAQWGDPSGGPVKQVLTDSLNAIYERASINSVSWGAWGRNYNAVSKPKLGSDLLTSGGALLTDTNTLNANQQWTEVSGTGKPSDNAGTTLTFYDAQSGFSTRGNAIYKSNFDSSWQVNIWSRESYAGSAQVSGEFVGADSFIGLSLNGQNIDTYSQLEFSIYARGDNQVEVYESGTPRGAIAVPTTGVFSITYDGVTVRYWNANTVIYTSTLTIYPNWTMFAGFNAYRIGSGVKNIQFGSFTDNSWQSVGGTGRPADNATVGAPVGTYVGSTLSQTVEQWAADPASRVNANTVTIDGGKITAGTVDTNQLKAGSVKTAQLLVGTMTELNPDPGFRDTNFWVNNGAAGNGPLGTSAGSVSGWYNSHGSDINNVMGTTQYCMLWEAYWKGSGRQHLISAIRSTIKGGTTYQFSALGRNASNQRINVLCRMYNVDGAHTGDAVLSWAPGEHRLARTQFVAPTGTVSYHFYVYNDAGVNFGGNCQVADLQVIEAMAGTAILNGAITTDHMVANTIDGDRVRANSLHADKLVANTITTGKLAVQNRPVSVTGINLRVGNDNVVRWDRGTIIFPDANGNYIYRTVLAGAYGWQGWAHPVNLCYDSNADNVSLGVYYSQDLPAYSSQLPVAIWANGQDLVMRAGTSTVINGDRIQTGTINGNRLIADTITANEIQAGAIGVAELAAGAVVTSKLAVGNTDNIVPDGEFRDVLWWNSGVADSRYVVEDVPFSSFRRALRIQPGGGIDNYSTFFPVEPGATYKMTMGVDLSGDFNGTFRPWLHMPGWAWFSMKAGGGVDPGTSDPAHVFNVAGTSANYETIITNPNIVQCRQWQFRLTGTWTGTVRFAVKIVRVSDTTLIQNGAVTTDKITVNSLNGDRIQAGTMAAEKIQAGTVLSNTVTVAGTTGNIGDAVVAASNAANNNWYCPDPRFYSFAGNRITKQFANSWDTNAYTRELYVGGCVMSGKLVGDGTFMGISDNQANGNYGLINYGWHRSQDGNTYIFESGNLIQAIGSNGAVGADTVNFSVVYDGRTVRYYRNEFLHREVAVAANRQFAGAIGIAPPGSYVAYASFQAGNDNSLTRTDPAERINANTTTILPGKITIQGGTTLDAWRDQTSIRGGAIATNSISAEKIALNSRGITVLGCDFRYEAGRLWWSWGHILYTDDNGNAASPYIPEGSVAWAGGSYNYIFWDKGAGGFRHGVDNWEGAQVRNSNSIIMCTWRNGSNFVANYGGTIVSGDRIVTRTIAADKMNVGSLSAISANVGTVTAGLVRSTSGNAYFDLDNARIVFNNGSVMKVQGVGFGSAGQFIEWFGPVQNSFGNCSEANATYYLKTDGSAYFGGALSAGTLKNSVQTTALAGNADVTTGTFGSNGKSRVVTVGYAAFASQQITGACPAPYTPYATIRLYRGTNAGGTLLAEQRINGTNSCSPGAGQYEPGNNSDSIGGSITYTDNTGGSSSSYYAQVVDRYISYVQTQSLSVTSVEQ